MKIVKWIAIIYVVWAITFAIVAMYATAKPRSIIIKVPHGSKTVIVTGFNTDGSMMLSKQIPVQPGQRFNIRFK